MSRVGATSAFDAVVWSAVLLGGIALLAVLVWWIRRRTLSHSAGGESQPGLTLQNLRRMKAEAMITEEEFQRLRDRLLNSPEMRMLRGAEEEGGAKRR